jgi:hypothetical protein
VTGKILMALAVIMVATAADGLAAVKTSENTASSRIQNSDNIPDAAQISSDLVGNYMYVSDGLPGLWVFSSPAAIQFGNIGSSRRDGDHLEFNFTMFLVDDKTGQRDLYRAETLVTYTQVDGAWELLTVQGNSINKIDSDGSTPAIYSDMDC